MLKNIRDYINKHKLAAGIVALLISWRAYVHIDYNLITKKEQVQLSEILRDYDSSLKLIIKATEELDFNTARKVIHQLKEDLEKAKKIGPVDESYIMRLSLLESGFNILDDSRLDHEINTMVGDLLTSLIDDNYLEKDGKAPVNAQTMHILQNLNRKLSSVKDSLDPILWSAFRANIKSLVATEVERFEYGYKRLTKYQQEKYLEMLMEFLSNI